MTQIWVLLEDRLAKSYEKNSWLFTDPVNEFIAFDEEGLAQCFRLMQEASHQGLYLAGYLAYEALNHFYGLNSAHGRPLLHFFAFHGLDKLSQDELEQQYFLGKKQEYSIERIHLLMDESEYHVRFKQIKTHLMQGDSYQINFTNKYLFDFHGDPLSLYLNLRDKQRVSYGGFLNFGSTQILSCSPELFLQKTANRLITRPMKGTLARLPDQAEDEAYRQRLQQNEKLRSENLIIVDLLRNDLSAISQPGSVSVKKLLEIETYASLHQMTTTIESKLASNQSIADIFKGMFPGGSITGAPKKRSMEIISQVEKSPRHLYTGSMGYILPNADFCFNVAIRSIYIQQNQAELGIGGGITYDSNVHEEFSESILKARFFIRSMQTDMVLFESILWTQGQGYCLLPEHLGRLHSAAQDLDFPFDKERLELMLAEGQKNLKEMHYKVQIFLDRKGEIKTNYHPICLSNLNPKPKVGLYLSSYLHSTHPLLPYKIYNSEVRRFYQHAREMQPLLSDLIFVNERQEITESSIANIMLEMAGERFTPSLSSGLLPGIMRASLGIQERRLTIDDLRSSSKIWLMNSVRGVWEVDLCPKSY